MRRKGKRILVIGMAGILLVMGTGCGTGKENADLGNGSGLANGEWSEGEQVASLDWQGQYDLGIRLLGEGKYEEAIIAFTAAIEIAPSRSAL